MFNSISDIKKANKESGYHFFSPGAMRFFNSSIVRGLIGNRYFVSGEKQFYWHKTKYTVRRASDDGTIMTMGGFMQFDTAKEAKQFARKFAELEKNFGFGSEEFNRFDENTLAASKNQFMKEESHA